MATSPAHARLKAATAPIHEALDAQMMRLDLRQPSGLGVFLLVNARALRAIDTSRGAYADALRPGLLAARRACTRDLAHLGLTGAERALGPKTGARGIPCHLGTAYVIAGARIGARHILRMVESSPHAQVRGATRFLRETALDPVWPRVLRALRATPAHEMSATIQDAHRSFGLFAEALAIETVVAA